jgi:hypothetical protein
MLGTTDGYHSEGGGGSSPQGATQAMPFGQEPAQAPEDTGAQAVPGGNPSAMQSASRWQSAQAMPGEQTLLPAVVRKQWQSARLLQAVLIGVPDWQTPATSCAQVPVSWARHLRLPFFPSQIPEQHCSSLLQMAPTLRQPKALGFDFFFLFLRFRFAALGPVSRRKPSPSPTPVRPRRMSRRDGMPIKECLRTVIRCWSTVFLTCCVTRAMAGASYADVRIILAVAIDPRILKTM